MLARLAQLMPSPLVRLFASPYLGGRSLEEGVALAERLYREHRFCSTLDILGEFAGSEAVADHFLSLTLGLLQRLAAQPWPPTARPTLSVKLSALFSFTAPSLAEPSSPGYTAALERGQARLDTLCATALEHGLSLTLDMEDHPWTEFTLRTFERLRERGQRHVGLVLQSMLHRTESDAERLQPGDRVRLVIGIYREPPSIALTDRRAMKERLLVLAGKLLARGVYVEFATHDAEYLHRFLSEVVVPGGYSPEQFEVQVLLGVPMGGLTEALAAGSHLPGVWGRPTTVRVYVPVAESWEAALPYLRRRMRENPHIIRYVLANLLKETGDRR